MPLFSEAELQALRAQKRQKENEILISENESTALESRQLAALQAAHEYFKQAAAEYAAAARMLGLTKVGRELPYERQGFFRTRMDYGEIRVWDLGGLRRVSDNKTYLYYSSNSGFLYSDAGKIIRAPGRVATPEELKNSDGGSLEGCALQRDTGTAGGYCGKPLPEKIMRDNVDGFFRTLLRYRAF